MTDDAPNASTNIEKLDELAGEYVLGTLDDTARRDVERRLPQEAALQKAVARWESRLAPYASMVEPLTPPSALWSRIERSIAERPATAERSTIVDTTAKSAAASRGTASVSDSPRASRDTRWGALWQSLTLWRGVSLAGITTALGLALLLALNPMERGPRYMVVLSTPQHTQAGWMVQAGSQRDIELIPLDDFQVPAGKTLQFWTKADDWSGPVSLGLVEANRSRRLTLDDLPPLEENQLFELTLENAGGSPLNRPTGPIQFIGRAVSL